MYDLELMRRVSGIGQLSEKEQSELRQNREQDDGHALESLEAASPFDSWTGEAIAALVSPEAETLVVNFEVTSRKVYERKYVRPEWPGGASGVTIGIGYDVGYHPKPEVQAHWQNLISDSDIALLTTAVGLTGASAKSALARYTSVQVPWDAAMSAYRRSTIPKYGRLVLKAFPNAETLHGHAFGALFSLVFNRGASLENTDKRKEMREIRDLMAAKAFDQIPGRFLAMRRHWATQNLSGLLKRREMEAALFARGVELMKAPPAVADAASAWTPVVLQGSPAGTGTEVPGTVFEGASDPVFETADEIARRDGDGVAFDEEPGSDTALEVAQDWDVVTWVKTDDDAPDYNHIKDRALAGKTFEFGWQELELLFKANGFEPTREHGRIVFGLRGAALVTSLTDASPMLAQEERDVLTLKDVRPDHKDFRCILGVYNPSTRRVSGFSSSTVPNRKAVYTYYSAKTSGNMMPTGCYRFEVGWHLASKPDRKIPGCLIENGRQKAVLRSPKNPFYDLPDAWENNRLHGDNLHPAKSEKSARFSSWGCLVVKGNYICETSDRTKGRHTEEWALFRKAMGWAPTGTGDHRKEYDVILLTGLEAAIANDLIKTGKSGDDALIDEKLARVRQGSRGERVRRLQEKLSVTVTGVMNHASAKALAEWQKSKAGGLATGIYTPDMDKDTGWGVFAPLVPSGPIVIAGTQGTVAATRFETAGDGPVFEAAGSDARLEQMYYEIGHLAATAQREGGNLESVNYEGFSDTQLEWGFGGFASLGAGIAKMCEDKLREVVCGADTIDRIAGDEIRSKINDYSTRGTQAIRAILVEALSKTIGLPLPRTVIEKAVDVVIEKVLLPITGPLGPKAMDTINVTTQMMCTQWAASGGLTGGIKGGVTGDATPSPAAPPAPPVAEAPPATTIPAATGQVQSLTTTASTPPAAPPAAASTSARARQLLDLIAAAAQGTTPDSAGVRRYIGELRDHLAATGETLAPIDNQRLLDALVDTRFMNQIVGAVGADPYQLMGDVEKVLKEEPQNKKAFDEKLAALNEALSDARVKIQPDAVKKFLKALRGAKKFDVLSQMADRFVTRDPKLLGLVSNAYAQGLIDSGRIVAALEFLRAATAHGVMTEEEAIDADGIRGRAHKQIYMNYVRTASDAVALNETHGDQLRMAIDAYKGRYNPQRPVETYYHGINYLALLKRAEADRITVEDAAKSDELARSLIDPLEKAAPDTKDPWLLASLGEAYLAAGNADKAAEYFGRYAKHPDVDAFALAGTIRQLKEVWRINASQSGPGAIVTRLMAALARKEDGEVTLDAAEQQTLMGMQSLAYGTEFETFIPGGTDVGFAYMYKMVMSGAAVAGIYKNQTPLAQPIGTGFLIHGPDLHPSLTDDRSYLLTNAHVMWCPKKGPGTIGTALPPDQVRVLFDVDAEAGRKRLLSCANVIWQSGIEEHDACLIALNAKIPQAEIPTLRVTSAANELVVNDDPALSTPLAVVGHPNRNKLTIRFRGGILDQHGTLVDKGPHKGKSKPEYLHYKTQTDPGNSGSPVFETNGWSVVALHHAGPKYLETGLPKLGNKEGTNAANEGIWIESIREALAATLTPSARPESAEAAPKKSGTWWRRG